MEKRKSVLQIACTGLVLLLMSCAEPKVMLQVQRNPHLDITGISRVAVMPFETRKDAMYQNVAHQATTVASSKIQSTNRFTLVSHLTILAARKKSAGMENYADALFTGQITNINENSECKTSSWTDKNGKTHVSTSCERVVEVDFSYSFVRTRDGSIIGPVVKKGRANATAESQSGLSSIEELANKAVAYQLQSLPQDIAPYTVMVQRTLQKDNSLKPQMEAALEHLKANNYIAARKAYLAIWESNQSVAAAINASILYEAMGEIQNAANFMEQVFATTGSPVAMNELSHLNRELGEQAKLEQYKQANDNAQKSSEKVTNYAISEIRKVLPKEVKLWIYNGATSNLNLANDVIDNMVSAFVKSGIPIVERQMIDMIVKEQNFQISGSVNDYDIAKIGNLAGTNIIVIVNITGTGSGRRLQVRVLDIVAGIVLMQSNTNSEWNL
jgi:tetratricopeptide (TPR) repeat protein